MTFSPESPGVEEAPSQPPASAEAPLGPWRWHTASVTASDDDGTADTASESGPSTAATSVRGSRESVMAKAKSYTKDWFATGRNHSLQQISGEDLRKIWWFSVRAMRPAPSSRGGSWSCPRGC